jgi:hypothetical protein
LSGPLPVEWQCPGCDHLVRVSDPPRTATPQGETLHACAVCGNAELYKKKGFPHWLGLMILALAALGFLAFHYYRLQWWAWGVLIGSALIDGILYLAVKDVVVCYRCGAEHRGVGRSGNQPFELTIHERYRQQRLRLEQQKLAGAAVRRKPER